MARSLKRDDQQFLHRAAAVVANVPLSVAAWFRSDSDQGNALVTISDASSPMALWLALASGYKGRAIAQAGSPSYAITTGTYTPGEWSHLAGVWVDATTRHAWINGGGKGSKVQVKGVYGLGGTTLGAWAQGDPPSAVYGVEFDGLLGPVAVWSVALGDDEVASLAAGVSPLLVRPASLVAYWPLGGLDGRHDRDVVGGHHLTAWGGPTWSDSPPLVYPSDPLRRVRLARGGSGRLAGPGASVSASGRAWSLADGAEALRVYVAGVEVVSLTAVGTLPGVVIDHAAGANGPGAGRLRYDDDGLAWRPPGQAEFGAGVSVIDGSYWLAGVDTDQYLRVTVHADHLVLGSQARVLLADRFGNALGHDDVTAGEALAGDVAYYQLTLANDSAGTLYHLSGWIEPGTPNLKISADGATYLGGATFGDLAAGATTTCYLRRTIIAGADADAKILNHLHFRFDTAV